MRVAELSERSGVAIPTIKYYLREGLLPPGRSTGRNQASYDDGHARRLKLIRVLLDVGRMPIAAIRDLLDDLDRPQPDLHRALGHALIATAGPARPGADGPAPARATGGAAQPDGAGPGAGRAGAGTGGAGPATGTGGVGPATDGAGAATDADREVDELIRRRGWQVGTDAPARRRVAEVIAVLRQLGAAEQVDRLDDYAAAAEAIAAVDLDLLAGAEPDLMIYRAVIGTILGDALITGLRRLAQEDASAKRFGAD